MPAGEGERFYLRILLAHVRGACGWEDLRTVPGVNNNRPFATFREACIARGLLETDDEWRQVLEDAAAIRLPRALRQVFALILVYCNPNDGHALWQQFKVQLCEDIMHRFDEVGEPSQQTVREALLHIEEEMHACNITHQQQLQQGQAPGTPAAQPATAGQRTGSLTLQAYGITIPPAAPRPTQQAAAPPLQLSAIEQRERTYDAGQLAAECDDLERSLTAEQRAVFERIDSVVQQYTPQPRTGRAQSRCMFLHSVGGCGKTWLLNLVLKKVRSRGHVALATASTGVAALLLQGGTTAHFTLRLALKPDPHLQSCFSKNSDIARLIQQHCRLIVIDEATGLNRRLIEQLDRTLRDVMDIDAAFGGVPLLLSGDFGQTLPVVRRGGPAEQKDATLPASDLWQAFQHLQLTENQRTQRAVGAARADLQRFERFLLGVRDGSLGSVVQVGALAPAAPVHGPA